MQYSNRNLTHHNDITYFGWPLQRDKGPFYTEYLETLHRVIQQALHDHGRVFAFRCDLRFPAGCSTEAMADNRYICRFIKSLKSKVAHNRIGQVHDTRVRYVWAREEGQRGVPHYHVLILVNAYAFNSLGRFDSEYDNMALRLQGAWRSALYGVDGPVAGLVEIPMNATYEIRPGDFASQHELFHRACYLCKAATKVYGNHVHAFGSSKA